MYLYLHERIPACILQTSVQGSFALMFIQLQSEWDDIGCGVLALYRWGMLHKQAQVNLNCALAVKRAESVRFVREAVWGYRVKE